MTLQLNDEKTHVDQWSHYRFIEGQTVPTETTVLVIITSQTNKKSSWSKKLSIIIKQEIISVIKLLLSEIGHPVKLSVNQSSFLCSMHHVEGRVSQNSQIVRPTISLSLKIRRTRGDKKKVEEFRQESYQQSRWLRLMYNIAILTLDHKEFGNSQRNEVLVEEQ